jgi:hypothetical protein
MLLAAYCQVHAALRDHCAPTIATINMTYIAGVAKQLFSKKYL